MLKTKQEIQQEIDKCKKQYEEILATGEHISSIDFTIENCDIEAMREITGDRELRFGEYSSKMSCYVQLMDPTIRLRSPEIEVEEHKVESYAYKNV